jgi:hypothetical protein
MRWTDQVSEPTEGTIVDPLAIPPTIEVDDKVKPKKRRDHGMKGLFRSLGDLFSDLFSALP